VPLKIQGVFWGIYVPPTPEFKKQLHKNSLLLLPELHSETSTRKNRPSSPF
jgi:hypothetical protein